MEDRIMKKILYTLITTLLLISCHDDEMISNVPSSKDEGKLVELKVSLHIPDMQKSNSRAFGEGSLDYFASCPLQMVVFDGNGYLKEFLNVIDKPADNDLTSTGIYAIIKDETNNEIDFKVRLHEAVSKRIIHVIVNSPQDTYEFGDESTLISNLSVSLNNDLSGNDTYWQRVELPNIIENTTLSRIPMIRNFAKITVSPNPDGVTVPNGVRFTYEGFVVMNIWNKGTVAPYQGNGGFAQLNNGEEMNSYRVIKDEKNYEGIWPSDANLVYNDIDEVGTDAHPLIMNTTSGLTPFYMYERRNTYVSNDIPSTYILVKANYGGADCWYKLDLVHDVDAQGKMITDPDKQTVVGKQYYNIIRNFHYAITIDAVTGAGYSTAEEASRRPASNNLSGSVDIRDLTNISDAVNRLFVSYTDITLVNDGSYNNTNNKLQATIKYKYVGANNNISNDDVIITELPIDVEEDCLVEYQKANADENGWRTVTVTFDSDKLPSSYLDVFTNKLQFSKNGLSREVDFNIRGIIPMIVECKPSKVPTGVKQQVAANILIPNGITLDNDPYQLFPLEFWVEAEELTISPDVERNKAVIKQSPYEMPVASGTSIIPSKADENKQTFRYKRTITYEEYNNLELKTVNYTTDVEGNALSTPITGDYKVIPCYFLTNTTNSESKVYAQNELFTLRRVGEFKNGAQDIKNATLTDTGIYGIGQTATLTFTAVTAGTYTITSGNLSEPSRRVSKTVELGANAQASVNLVTATWEKTSMVTIKAPDDAGTEYDVMAEARKTLPMKATTTLNGSAFTTNPTFQVYTDQTSALAWADNKVTDVTNSALTSTNGISKEIPGLKEGTELWFAFQSGGYVYVASTTAGALANKTAVLAFTNDNRVEIPLEMSAEFGNGTQYYGERKTFTLTFTTNKAGTYKFTSSTLTFASNSNGITVSDNQFTVSEAGTYTFTCTTTTWGAQAFVTISRNGEEDKSITVEGDERLWFKFGKMTGGSNTPENNQDITVYGVDGTVYGTVKWSALSAGTAELKIESIKNISDPDNANLCYFQYSKTEWSFSGGRPSYETIIYKTDVQNIPQARDGTTLNFKQQ